MSDTISMLTAALKSDESSLKTISHNIANSNNVAYRREIGITQSFSKVSEAFLTSQFSSLTVPEFFTETDMTPGGLRSSPEPLHVAIEGPGFFVVSTPTGDILTRKGDFQRNAAGQLATENGHPVLGEGGPISLGAQSPSIDSNGTLWSAGKELGRLLVVSVPDVAALQSMGGGTFSAGDMEFATTATTSSVRQGYLESANVSAVNEMIRLMEVLRHFETAQRFVRGYDEMMSQAISQLGRV